METESTFCPECLANIGRGETHALVCAGRAVSQGRPRGGSL